jgi:hypothetical protein
MPMENPIRSLPRARLHTGQGPGEECIQASCVRCVARACLRFGFCVWR